MAIIEGSRAQQILSEVVARNIQRDRGNYGYGEATERDVYSVLLTPRVHNFRLDEMPSFTNDPNLFATHRTILDIGCGTAPLVYGALEKGLTAYGIDNDYEKIVIAHLKASAFGYPADWAKNVIQASAYELPFADRTFDIVTSFQVLEHLDNLNAGLYEAVRVTKPGGWIIFRAPDYRMSFEPHYRIPWPQFAPPRLAERWVMAMGRPPGGLGTFFYITLPQVQSVLENLGCVVQFSQLYAIQEGRYEPVEAPIASSRLLFTADTDIANAAAEIKQQTVNGTLPKSYSTELGFAIAAKRIA